MNHNRPLNTILLVDDDSEVRSLMKAFLQHAGYAVLSCHDAQRASEVFRSRPNIDLLLTDINMPDSSGLDLARELTVQKPTLPVILISGDVLTNDRAEEIHSRAWKFVPKPTSLPYLLDLIHTAISRNMAMHSAESTNQAVTVC